MLALRLPVGLVSPGSKFGLFIFLLTAPRTLIHFFSSSQDCATRCPVELRVPLLVDSRCDTSLEREAVPCREQPYQEIRHE